MRAENEAIVRRYFELAWNRGDLDVLDELIASDTVNHTPGMPDSPPGPEGLKPIVAYMRSAFPDLRYTIEDLVVDEGKVAARVTMRGTHLGEFAGIAPTGRAVEVAQMQVEYIAGGKIVEHWRTTDELALFRQLGRIPA